MRLSSSRAFQHPVLHRQNLKVFANTMVERINLLGKRATGITVRRNGDVEELTASVEVVLLADAITRANDTENSPGSGVWSRNVSTVHRVARGLRTGTVWANCHQAMDPAVPFGGYKMSGFGRESGAEHLHEYLQTKAVLITLDGAAKDCASAWAWAWFHAEVLCPIHRRLPSGSSIRNSAMP